MMAEWSGMMISRRWHAGPYRECEDQKKLRKWSAGNGRLL
jgi:hypothetical protein